MTDALASVPAGQPAQVAGYWANRGFWLAEFRHLVSVALAYEERVQQMARGFQDYVRERGGPHNQDDCGGEYQTIRYTTTLGQRKDCIGQARLSLKRLADRAFDLRITNAQQYDDFLNQLKQV